MSKKELLLNAIEDMLNGDIEYNHAICGNLCRLTNTLWLGIDFVSKYCETWENFSGEKFYPISGEDSYDIHKEANSFREDDQLELRLSLLEHLKKELLSSSEEEIEELRS